MLSPDEMLTAPPVAEALVSPAVKLMWPPMVVELEPTVIAMSPLFPPTPDPVTRLIPPDAPAVLAPVENAIEPLTPLEPAPGVFTETSPLLVSAPRPLESLTAPPVAEKLDPPVIVIPLPDAVFVVAPTDITTDPAAPPVEAPVAKDSRPDEPELVVPEEN